MENVLCNYCGRDDTDVVNEGRDLMLNRAEVYRLVKCRHCQLIYLNPRPTREELPSHYPNDYILYTTDKKKDQSVVQNISQQHAISRRCDRVLKYAGKTGAVLDIGCATGQFLQGMREQGWQTTGVELSNYAAQFGREQLGLDVHTGTLEEAKFADNSFDVVTMWDVFEHVLDPKATLIEIDRILKPNGWIIMGVPNPESTEAKLFKKNWIGWDRPRHLHLFTQDVLQNYLTGIGFKIAGIESFDGRLRVTLLSLEFALKAHGWQEPQFMPWVNFAYNLPLRLLTFPLYKLGEYFTKTTGMTLFAQKV